MKRYLSLIFIISVLVSAVSCGSSESPDTVEETTAISEDSTESEEESEEDEWDSKYPLEEPTVIYDKNNIKIYYRGWGTYKGNLVLAVLIENGDDKNLMFQLRNFSVNDFVTRPAFSPKVAAGKKIYYNIRVLPEELEKNYLTAEEAEKVDFTFHIYNSDDMFEELEGYDSDIVTINLEKE